MIKNRHLVIDDWCIQFISTTYNDYYYHKCVFRALSNIYGDNFLRQQLTAKSH